MSDDTTAATPQSFTAFIHDWDYCNSGSIYLRQASDLNAARLMVGHRVKIALADARKAPAATPAAETPDIDTAERRKLIGTATDLPWKWEDHVYARSGELAQKNASFGPLLMHQHYQVNAEDAAFINAAVNDYPQLLNDRDALTQARQSLADTKAVLREVEWEGSTYRTGSEQRCCPFCTGLERSIEGHTQGHKTDCKLAAALAAAKASER